MIKGTTRLYAIVGDPITHVRTPMAFNDFFRERNIDAVCFPLQVRRDDLNAGWAGLKAMINFDGFIVTAPHKAAAASLCERLEADSKHSGVVNTVRRDPDGGFTGTLTDGRGFVRGLIKQGHAVKGQRFYLAGAGGAGTALAFALADAGVAALTIHNRTSARADRLVAAVARAYPAIEVRTGTADAAGHGIIVNATELGLKPTDGISFDLDSADRSALVAEVVMSPDMTPLLIAAEKRGHAIHFGIHMLRSQLDLMLQFLGVDKPKT